MSETLVESFLRDLKSPQFTQADAAEIYAILIRGYLPDAPWVEINAAIRERWKGKTALWRVKKMAWDRVEVRAGRCR